MELRTRILAAARSLVLEQGFDAMTMRSVAARVEYSPGALYWHFRDKRALVQALVAEDYWEFARVIRVAMNVVDPVERLRRGGEALVDYALSHQDQYRLIFLMPREQGAQDFPTAPDSEAPEDAYSLLQRAVRDCIASGRFAAPITDVDIVAQAIWSGMHGVLALHIVRGRDGRIPWKAPRQTAAMVRDLMIEVLGKHAPSRKTSARKARPRSKGAAKKGKKR